MPTETKTNHEAIYTYTLPERYLRANDPRTVGMRELTARDEIAAAKAGAGDVVRAAFAQIRAAIARLDGRPAEPEQVEAFWAGCHPKVRSLLVQAYNRIAIASDDEEKAFFDSQVVEV